MRGMAVSYRIVSINGNILFMVRSIFVDDVTVLIAKFSVDEPTK